MAIISREKKSGTNCFVQWCLMFSPKHPILLRAINMCIYNINNKISNNLVELTGPVVFTNAVNFVLKKKYLINSKKNLFFYKDKDLNNLFNKDENYIKCKFFGSDYNNFCQYDNGCKDIILKDSVYWKNDKEIFNF